MLARLLPRPSHFRILPFISSKLQSSPQIPSFASHLRFLSSNGNNSNGRDGSFSDPWKYSRESEGKFDSLFHEEGSIGVSGMTEPEGMEGSWVEAADGKGEDVFEGAEKEAAVDGGSGNDADEWYTSEKFEPWSLGEEEKDVFDVEGVGDFGETGSEHSVVKVYQNEEAKKLEAEEKELMAVLKGPSRAFGDLIAASGITDEMLDSLIALKDLEGVEGLPPLSEIEDARYERNTRRSSGFERELKKQEEIAKARVRQVDDKGRAYGTGRRKCSIARVFIQPGGGKFIVNDKEFDVYFPMLDHRATLLRPFTETKTLGLWDVTCTVKGGGVSGQVGAIRLGISRALQNWEPDLRPPLRAAGFLTRDPRVVERKKPGKAKARKSFQWVKR